jgi:hypothetical protein
MTLGLRPGRTDTALQRLGGLLMSERVNMKLKTLINLVCVPADNHLGAPQCACRSVIGI